MRFHKGRKFSVLGILAIAILTLATWLIAGREACVTSDRGDSGRFVEAARDDFTDGLNDRWTPLEGKPGCCPLGRWSPNQVSVEEGVLRLQAEYDDDEGWLTGGVGGWKWDGAVHQYARVSVRVRSGAWAGISVVALLWPQGKGWPPELDFYEIPASQGDRQKLKAVTHFDPDNKQSQHDLAGDFTEWHVVTVEWRPDQVRYLMDGVEFGRDTGDSVPDLPMWIGLQTHVAEDPANLPTGAGAQLDGRAVMEVDWVEVEAWQPSIEPTVSECSRT